MSFLVRCLRLAAVGHVALAFAALIGVSSLHAQPTTIPPNPTPWPGPPGSYQGPVRFVVFTAMGNYQHSTWQCFIDGAFVALNNIVPVFGQPPYGEMAVLRAHPNYNEMVTTLIAAKLSGATVDIQVIKDPNVPNSNQYPPKFPLGCDQIPIVGAVGLVN